MTTVADLVRADPLAPLRAELLRAARADADALLADADSDAAQAVARARQQADALLADARARGHEDADAVRADVEGRAERRARGLVLQAQRHAYDELRELVQGALADRLAARPDPGVLAALRDRAERDLGAGASVTEQGPQGVVAERGSVQVRYLFADLAEQAVEALGTAVEELWTP